MHDLEAIGPAREPQVLCLPGGEPVLVRPIGAQDAGFLQGYMRNLSDESRRNRFLGAVSELAPTELDRLTRMDRRGEAALMAFAGAGDDAAIIGEAVHAMTANGARCECALSVAEDWRRRGLGTLLLRTIECRARMLGARYLFGDVLRSNAAMKGLARKAGFAVRSPLTDARLIEIVKDLSGPQLAAVAA